MSFVKYRDYQLKAIDEMHNGCILCGGVGSGKSLTALGYYYICNGGRVDTEDYTPMDFENVQDLYIITTARKRDTLEWECDMSRLLIYPPGNLYSNKVVVDSWNNIKKYSEIKGAFFIFDEQRLVGNGTWVKSFLKIAKSNQWVLLSATPGDTWLDYIPVFVANGFYKNRSEFLREHVVYSPFSKFPKVDRYLATGKLLRLRNRILVNMDFKRPTESHHIDVPVEYDKLLYKSICKDRWNIYKEEPIENASEFCQVLRHVVNSDESRQKVVLEIFEVKNKVIIFYNYDYELEILRNIADGNGITVSEWNGHKHQDVPSGEKWMYLVQYNAGAEAWNCITTDTIIFFSQNYSYKIMVQSAGRIDRMNTPYRDLYFYHLKSKSSIDLAIDRALKSKKKFNETKFFSSV